MPNYTKLFNSIVTSTIWTEDDKTRIVWITMLALSDQNGEVHASIPGLARLAGIALPDVETALGKFLSPDTYSRTPDNEGRRIAPIDGGWELLNHAKYRRMASMADSKDANAKRQKRHRDRNATVTPSNATVTPSNATVTPSNATVTVKTDKAEAEAEAEAKAKAKRIPPNPQGGNEDEILPFQSEKFATAWKTWKDHRKEIKKKLTPTSVAQQFKRFQEWGEPKSIAAIEYTIEKGWQGLVESPTTSRDHPKTTSASSYGI